MLNIICPLCEDDQEADIFYPATFKEEEISLKTFSARRLPDRVHYQILICRNCGLLFSSPVLSPKKIQNFYKQSFCTYEKEISYLTKTYLKIFAKVKAFLPKKPKILEIGCGTGFFLEALRKRGFTRVFGVEPSKNAVARASKFLQKRIKKDLFRPRQFSKESFDLICSFQTLDHVVDLHEFLSEAWRILSKKGIVLAVVHDSQGLSVKIFGERSPIFDLAHIYFFNKETLKKFFVKHNFQILEVFNVVNSYSPAYYLRMIPLPAGLKKIIQGTVNILGFENKELSLMIGNIGIIARKNLRTIPH